MNYDHDISTRSVQSDPFGLSENSEVDEVKENIHANPVEKEDTFSRKFLADSKPMEAKKKIKEKLFHR